MYGPIQIRAVNDRVNRAALFEDRRQAPHASAHIALGDQQRIGGGIHAQQRGVPQRPGMRYARRRRIEERARNVGRRRDVEYPRTINAGGNQGPRAVCAASGFTDIEHTVANRRPCGIDQ